MSARTCVESTTLRKYDRCEAASAEIARATSSSRSSPSYTEYEHMCSTIWNGFVAFEYRIVNASFRSFYMWAHMYVLYVAGGMVAMNV